MAAFSTLDELLDVLRSVKHQLQQRWPVESLALFGSWVRDEAEVGSDVDLLIAFRPGEDSHIGMFDFFNIKVELETWLQCSVDLVERKALKPRLAERILPEAREI